MRIAPRAIPAVLGLSVVLAACQEPTTVERSGVVEEPSFELAGLACSRKTGTTVFTTLWPCDQGLQLRFVAGPGGNFTDSEKGIISGAASAWDEELRSATLKLPRFGAFTAGKTPQTIDVRYGGGSGTCWKGTVPKTNPPSPVTLTRDVSSVCGTSTLRGVAIQELSHVLGFTDKWDNAVGSPSVTGHCSGRSYSGQVTGTICQHEIETVYQYYGFRGGVLDYDKHILTGLEGLTNITLELGDDATQSVTHLSFDRANGTFCGRTSREMCPSETLKPVSTNASFTWSDSPNLVDITPTGAGSTKTITAHTAGTTTLKVTTSTTVYERAARLGDPGTGSTATINVTATPPAGPPTTLSASNITATSARISWTNGDTSSGTTTFVQYRMTGQIAWITANGGVGLPAGQSSYNLTGLHCATSYDVSVFHRKNGVNSPALTLTLFTTSACTTSATINPPSGFNVTSCTAGTTNGKPNATYHVRWTAGANPASSIFHIGESFSNSSGSAVVIRRGPISTVTANLGPYTIEGASSRYFWVRHANGALASSWVALLGNPIVISNGCAGAN